MKKTQFWLFMKPGPPSLIQENFLLKNHLSFSPSLFVFVNFARDDQQAEEQDREEKSSV